MEQGDGPDDVKYIAAKVRHLRIFEDAEEKMNCSVADAGGVYPDFRHDARLSTLKHSYGVHLRPRAPGAPVASFGVDWGPEGKRLTFSFGGVQ